MWGLGFNACGIDRIAKINFFVYPHVCVGRAGKGSKFWLCLFFSCSLKHLVHLVTSSDQVCTKTDFNQRFSTQLSSKSFSFSRDLAARTCLQGSLYITVNAHMHALIIFDDFITPIVNKNNGLVTKDWTLSRIFHVCFVFFTYQSLGILYILLTLPCKISVLLMSMHIFNSLYWAWPNPRASWVT